MVAPLRWGVVGVGVAGKARARAIADDPRAVGVCGLRGDPAAVGLRRVDALDALIAEVDVVAVCSPDPTHPAVVRAALEAGRHVVCEYPLAPTAREARALFALAADNGLRLHVEHIELLTPQARHLRMVCRPDQLRGGALRWVGPPRGDQPRLPHANLARLHRLVDTIGLPRRIDVQRAEADAYMATLRFDNGATVELSLQAAAGARRHLELTLVMESGVALQVDQTLLWRGGPVSPPPQPLGLFAQDQRAASALILDDAPPYVNEERVVALLELADNLERAGELWRGLEVRGQRRPG